MPSKDPAVRAKHQRDYWARWQARATPEEQEAHREKMRAWGAKYRKTEKAKAGAKRRRGTPKGQAAILRNRYTATAIFNRLKHHAARRGIPFSLTKTDVATVLAPMKCAVTGMALCFPEGSGGSLRSPSIDRIDNDGGYEPGNIQCTALWVNYARNGASLEEFNAILSELRVPSSDFVTLA